MMVDLFFGLIQVKIKLPYIVIFEINIMNTLPEEFLSIEEVAIYLEKFGYSYDLEKQHEYKRLRSKIYDLSTQHNVAAVFHYYGWLQEEIEEVEYDKDINTGEPVRIPIYQEVNNVLANGHYYVDKAFLKNILINEMPVKLDSYISKYVDTASTYQNQELSYSLHSSIYISSRDIRIPRRELDNLSIENVSTSTTNNQTVNSNHKLISDRISSYTGGIGKHEILQGNPKTDKQIIDEFREKVAQLTTENKKLKSQPEQQINTPIDDEPIHHKTVNSMATLIATLLKLASYDKEDLENPHGNINKEIIAKAEGLGLTLGKSPSRILCNCHLD